MITKSLVNILRQVDQIQILPGDLLVQVQHVLGLVLEVRGGVEAVRDVNSVVVGLHGLVPLGDADELLSDCADQVEGELDLFLGFVGFDHSADDCDVGVFLADAVDC